jgi:hypothetical protein
MVWYVTVRYGTVRYGTVWYGSVWYGSYLARLSEELSKLTAERDDLKRQICVARYGAVQYGTVLNKPGSLRGAQEADRRTVRYGTVPTKPGALKSSGSSSPRERPQMADLRDQVPVHYGTVLYCTVRYGTVPTKSGSLRGAWQAYRRERRPQATDLRSQVHYGTVRYATVPTKPFRVQKSFFTHVDVWVGTCWGTGTYLPLHSVHS